MDGTKIVGEEKGKGFLTQMFHHLLAPPVMTKISVD
jgi:hypothetical protein